MDIAPIKTKHDYRNEVRGDLPFEFTAMGAVLGHGFHPLKPGFAHVHVVCNVIVDVGTFAGSDPH
jgi:hypothetical protein